MERTKGTSPKNTLEKGTRILIVDDEPEITQSLKLGLGRRGFDVTTFNDPVLAAKEAKWSEYDLIILDIRMPKMNGFELYREIKKNNCHTAICFFSAFEIFQKEFSTMFPDVDAKVFLRKPVNLRELESYIKELTIQASEGG
jgi:two-component system, OmpR family, response regulator ChvI